MSLGKKWLPCGMHGIKINESIALLQSYEYQKERIQFYTERYRRLKEQADKRMPISIQ